MSYFEFRRQGVKEEKSMRTKRAAEIIIEWSLRNLLELVEEYGLNIKLNLVP